MKQNGNVLLKKTPCRVQESKILSKKKHNRIEKTSLRKQTQFFFSSFNTAIHNKLMFSIHKRKKL